MSVFFEFFFFFETVVKTLEDIIVSYHIKQHIRSSGETLDDFSLDLCVFVKPHCYGRVINSVYKFKDSVCLH